MVDNKPFENLITNFTAVGKKILEGMVISYSRRSSVIHLAITGTIAAEICKSLNLMVRQATAVSIRKSRTKVTNLRFTALDEVNAYSTYTNQKSFLLRPFKTKRDSAPRQQDPQVDNLENKSASPRDWQSMIEISLGSG